MSKFNGPKAKPDAHSFVASQPGGFTHQGGHGYTRDPKSELFLLAVTNMVGEDTFYEGASERDYRFRNLVASVALADPDWVLRFATWLRAEANMRSAAIVLACEAVKARLDGRVNEDDRCMPGSFNEAGISRRLIDAVCQRPDEPGELLAYWTSRYGRNVPKPVKRGVADAVRRLYSGKALIKWDSDAKGYRFGDVVELVHPAPAADKAWQGDLFEYALNVRHRGSDVPAPESNDTLRAYRQLMSLPVPARRPLLSLEGASEVLSNAGMTWEALAGWLQGPMDARAWQAIIPSMGYMALLRNLRNFDQARVSDEVAETVMARLRDPAEVARSRQLPFRFLSAYRAVPSDRWKWPLEKALQHSMGNVPSLPRRTLIMVDTSTSMDAGFSKDGTLMRWDAAALFGITLAQRCADAEVVSFSSAQRYYGDAPGARTKAYPLIAGESGLKSLERWKADGYFLGGGTDTAAALRQHYAKHDRVVILTDEQAAHDGNEVDESIPANVPIFTFNLAGYQHGHAPSGSANRHTFGGLTDACFRMIPLLESGRDAVWPF